MILLLGIARGGEDRKIRALGPRHANHLEAVRTRQSQVRDEQVPFLVFDQTDGLVPVLRVRYLIPAAGR